MKYKLLILTFFLNFLSGCSTHALNKSPKGEVVSNLDAQTFHVKYKGHNLRVGDRVSILQYKDFEADLKNHQSRNLPIKKEKIIIGKGVVSSILNDNYYELKSETPQHIPEGAFIEKL